MSEPRPVTPEDVAAFVEMTTFKRARTGVRLTFTDTRELIVAWPNGCPDQPQDHAQAVAAALQIVRAM